jgi:hypothetical protein
MRVLRARKMRPHSVAFSACLTDNVRREQTRLVTNSATPSSSLVFGAEIHTD